MWLPLTTITTERFLERHQAISNAFYAVGSKLASLHKEAGDAKSTYSLAGRLIGSKSGWLLLEVPNALVRGVFDALHEPGAELPLNSDGQLNGHISVCRPEEVERIGGLDKISERGHWFSYQLGPVQVVEPSGWVEMSRVWFVKVMSPELEKLRKSYGLSARPKNNEQNFHITIGRRRKSVLKENDVSKAAAMLSPNEMQAMGAGVHQEDPNPLQAQQPPPTAPATPATVSLAPDAYRHPDPQRHLLAQDAPPERAEATPDPIPEPVGGALANPSLPAGMSKLAEQLDFEAVVKLADERKKVVAVDLDGTLAEYGTWKGEDHFGKVRKGAVKALRSFKRRGMTILIHTCRGNTAKIKEWLEKNDVPFDHINKNPDQPPGASHKPTADFYIDDKAINAERPWHKIRNEVHARISKAASEYMYLPGQPGQNVVDRWQELQRQRGAWQASQIGAQADRPTYGRLLKGLGKMFGLKPPQEFVDQATGDVAKVAPYMSSMFPNAWEGVHGPLGSGAGIAHNLALSGALPHQAAGIAHMFKGGAAKNHHAPVVMVKHRDRADEVMVCPHCSGEIQEKDLYRDKKGWTFHRPCMSRGSIRFPEKTGSAPRLLQLFTTEKEASPRWAQVAHTLSPESLARLAGPGGPIAALKPGQQRMMTGVGPGGYAGKGASNHVWGYAGKNPEGVAGLHTQKIPVSGGHTMEALYPDAVTSSKQLAQLYPGRVAQNVYDPATGLHQPWVSGHQFKMPQSEWGSFEGGQNAAQKKFIEKFFPGQAGGTLSDIRPSNFKMVKGPDGRMQPKLFDWIHEMPGAKTPVGWSTLPDAPLSPQVRKLLNGRRMRDLSPAERAKFDRLQGEHVRRQTLGYGKQTPTTGAAPTVDSSSVATPGVFETPSKPTPGLFETPPKPAPGSFDTPPKPSPSPFDTPPKLLSRALVGS